MPMRVGQTQRKGGRPARGAAGRALRSRPAIVAALWRGRSGHTWARYATATQLAEANGCE
eukprot:304643-Prymnesium_polylepis.1